MNQHRLTLLTILLIACTPLGFATPQTGPMTGTTADGAKVTMDVNKKDQLQIESVKKANSQTQAQINAMQATPKSPTVKPGENVIEGIGADGQKIITKIGKDGKISVETVPQTSKP